MTGRGAFCFCDVFAVVFDSVDLRMCALQPVQGTTGATKKEDTVTADDVSGAKEEQVEEEEQEQAGEIEKEGVSARRRPRRET